MHKQTLQAKAGRYLNLKKLKFETWADAVKSGCRADILSVFALSALIGKHSLIHLHNGNLWTSIDTSSSDHDELLEKCDIHLAYMGNGLFCELRSKPSCTASSDGTTVELSRNLKGTTTVIKAEPQPELTLSERVIGTIHSDEDTLNRLIYNPEVPQIQPLDKTKPSHEPNTAPPKPLFTRTTNRI